MGYFQSLKLSPQKTNGTVDTWPKCPEPSEQSSISKIEESSCRKHLKGCLLCVLFARNAYRGLVLRKCQTNLKKKNNVGYFTKHPTPNPKNIRNYQGPRRQRQKICCIFREIMGA